MRIAKIGIILCVIILTGCAVASDVVPMGKDSYMVTAPETVMGQGRIIALKSANKYCASQDNHMIVRRLEANALTISLTFSCVSEDDPEYQRPNFKKDPSVIIENQH